LLKDVKAATPTDRRWGTFLSLYSQTSN